MIVGLCAAFETVVSVEGSDGCGTYKALIFCPIQPKYALASLSDLVRRYPPKLCYLTTLHTIFVRVSTMCVRILAECADWAAQLCVATGHFTAALPVLSEPITHVEMSLSDLTYNDNLIYHYSGGVALGALKRWREAEDYFEICVSAPAVVPAAIQLEAYKKLVLVQLIQYGEVCLIVF